jgi:hypothetical protein
MRNRTAEMEYELLKLTEREVVDPYPPRKKRIKELENLIMVRKAIKK